MQFKMLSLFFFIPFNAFFCLPQERDSFFIRINQLGYTVNDIKTGIIFSELPLELKSVNIRLAEDNTIIKTPSIKLKLLAKPDIKFKNIASFDFTDLRIEGEYYIEYSGIRSNRFKIEEGIFNNVVDSLLLFFKVQRCGPTDPYLHSVCHLSDIARVNGSMDSSIVDLTGGWHDAGDYIKFLSTTAYTTYLMMFAYEFDKKKFGFDHNHNGVADILDEAKIGLDWLLRCNYQGDSLVIQVQDTSDHSVGWRLPEQDSLRYNRVGFTGSGKNIIGFYTAALSMASRIWRDEIADEQFAEKCLRTALNFYKLKEFIPDIGSSASAHYKDTDFWGKISLAAIELFESTFDNIYLTEAKMYADNAGPDYWWSWGNMNSLAHYKIAKYDSSYLKYLRASLDFYFKNMNSSAFDEPMNYSWGTTNSFLGSALTEIFYRSLTKDDRYEKLSVTQRDFILGRNKWGLSFISGTGTKYPGQIHSQIAFFNNGYIPGALVGGPAPVNTLQQFNFIPYEGIFSYFNDDVQYHDERLNFITNEPTIISNATALFVMGYYSKRD